MLQQLCPTAPAPIALKYTAYRHCCLEADVSHGNEDHYMTKEEIILIYDGECALCRGAKDWILQRDARAIFTAATCRDAADSGLIEGGERLLCLRYICVLYPGRRLYSGVNAVSRILRCLSGWRWLGIVLMIPGIHFAARGVYALVSHNRYVFSRLFGFDCSDSACKDDRGK